MISDSLSKLGLKEKMIAVNAAILGLAALLIFFLIIPGITDIGNIKTEIEKQFADLDMKYQRGQSLRKLTQSMKLIEPELQNLDRVFIVQEKEVELITSLEDLAAKNNIAQKISLGAMPKGNSTIKKVPISLAAQGSFSNIVAYLHSLETSDYYLSIKSIEVISDGSTQEDDDAASLRPIAINLTLDSYWH
ncbi:type 4a pilus biogenesis protein PilO [Candidatus Falkowbacteria bacterium]|nr:type 4a pilus biogenesis protein PilO [Candidatus Falkowbacteria bacterium]